MTAERNGGPMQPDAKQAEVATTDASENVVLCPYCGLREATHRTPLYQNPACVDCYDAAGRTDDNALSDVLSGAGEREMANDGLVRDCEIDAASEAPRSLEGWVSFEAATSSAPADGEAAGGADVYPAWVECPHGCTEDYYCTIHNTHTDDCPCPPTEEWAVDPFVAGGRPIPPEHMLDLPDPASREN